MSAPKEPIEKQASERMAQEIQARLTGIIDSAMDAILSVNKDQKIVLFNTAAELMFGYTSAEVLGRPLEILLPEKYRVIHHQHVQQFSEAGVTNRTMGNLGKLYGLRANGEVFPLEASISQINTENGKILTVILRDITARARAEAEMLRKDQGLQAAAEENARLLTQTRAQLSFASALRIIDLAISSTLDLRAILNTLLEQVIDQLKMDAAMIFLLRMGTQQLEFVGGQGLESQKPLILRAQTLRGCAEDAFTEREIVGIENLDTAELDPPLAEFIAAERIQACYAAPLIVKGDIRGVLQVFQRVPFAPDLQWTAKFEALAGQAAIAIDNAQLFDQLKRSNQQLLQAYDATIKGWSRALDLRDHDTEGHTERVTDMALRVAEATGQFEEAELLNFRWGALLHDIGKMGVPDHILHKPDQLTAEEWTVMRRHPEYAYQMLRPVAFLRKSLDIPRYHHERWDGNGYPYGLREDHIPLPARLFSVVDVWDALRSERPYRPSWEEQDVLAYLHANAGTQFDPEAVSVFMQVHAAEPE